MINPQMSAEERVNIAKRCTWIGFAVNGILSVLKIIAGMLGRSGAMIADGIHSASDFVTDVLVVVFLGISARGDNKDYRYGHGKFETFATFLIRKRQGGRMIMRLSTHVSFDALNLWASKRGLELRSNRIETKNSCLLNLWRQEFVIIAR